jgi:hypothetical protein
MDEAWRRFADRERAAVDGQRRAAERWHREQVWRQEHRAHQRARRRKRQLAREVIDAGYRAVARRVHPDVGGSDDAMRWLQEVRDVLREAVQPPSKLRRGCDLFPDRDDWSLSGPLWPRRTRR